MQELADWMELFIHQGILLVATSLQCHGVGGFSMPWRNRYRGKVLRTATPQIEIAAVESTSSSARRKKKV
jgi:hypothetical protein